MLLTPHICTLLVGLLIGAGIFWWTGNVLAIGFMILWSLLILWFSAIRWIEYRRLIRRVKGSIEKDIDVPLSVLWHPWEIIKAAAREAAFSAGTITDLLYDIQRLSSSKAHRRVFAYATKESRLFLSVTAAYSFWDSNAFFRNRKLPLTTRIFPQF